MTKQINRFKCQATTHLHKVDETLHGMKQIISYPQKIPSKKPISTTRTFR